MSRQTAIIVGGSSQIGLAVGEALVTSGWHVLLSYRRHGRSVQRSIDDWSSKGYGDVAASFAIDLSDVDGIPKAFDVAVHTASSRWGSAELTALVNVAAVSLDGPFHTQPWTDVQMTLRVNLEAVARSSREALARGARGIVNVSSISSRRSPAGCSAYAASKGGVEALTRALAVELGPRGVRVNCVVPGLFDCGMTRYLSPAQKERLTSMIPLGRMGRPHEVADAVTFLLSERARFITGQCIGVDGGLGT